MIPLMHLLSVNTWRNNVGILRCSIDPTLSCRRTLIHTVFLSRRGRRTLLTSLDWSSWDVSVTRGRSMLVFDYCIVTMLSRSFTNTYALFVLRWDSCSRRSELCHVLGVTYGGGAIFVPGVARSLVCDRSGVVMCRMPIVKSRSL